MSKRSRRRRYQLKIRELAEKAFDTSRAKDKVSDLEDLVVFANMKQRDAERQANFMRDKLDRAKELERQQQPILSLPPGPW